MRLLNTDGKTMDECPLKPYHLVYVLNLMRDTKINANAAKIVLEDMYKNPADIHGYAELELPAFEIEAEAHVEKNCKRKRPCAGQR